MDQFDLALRFGSALALGVLLGLERERTKSVERSFAGVRTIGLIALSGALAAAAPSPRTATEAGPTSRARGTTPTSFPGLASG